MRRPSPAPCLRKSTGDGSACDLSSSMQVMVLGFLISRKTKACKTEFEFRWHLRVGRDLLRGYDPFCEILLHRLEGPHLRLASHQIPQGLYETSDRGMYRAGGFDSWQWPNYGTERGLDLEVFSWGQDLASALRESTATWKIVVAHHAIRSIGHHGDTEELVQLLLPILRVGTSRIASSSDSHLKWS